MKRTVLFLAVLIAAVVAFRMWNSGHSTEEIAPPTPSPTPDRVVRLDVGFTPEEQDLWHHHDEGSGFLPLSFFQALEDAETGKSFLESLPRFGLVADPNSKLGLPIGMSVGVPSTAPNDALLIGVSCAGCHSGQYTYRGTAMTIDGAPNMLDFEALLNALTHSLETTLSSPSKLFDLIQTVMKLEHEAQQEGELLEVDPASLSLMTEVAGSTDDHPLGSLREHLADGLHKAYHADSPEAAKTHLEETAQNLPSVDHSSHSAGQEAVETLRGSLTKFQDDLAYIRRHAERLVTLKKAFSNQTEAGPGRADSFGAIWDLLVQKDQVTALNAPVSIPHLYEYATFEWVHWDGNSSTVMGRDYSQAIALGADLIEETGESTVLPRNIIALEHTAQSLEAPAWPVDVLGPIDAVKAARGEAIYTAQCHQCHGGETLVPMDEIGTDPMRASNFASLEQDGKNYAQLLVEIGDRLTEVSFAAHEITPADLEPVERSDDPTWRITNAYHTRTLNGIWASPPYLHNGSVPTLWDLLQPASERPAEFQVGRELEPERVGIDGSRQPVGGWTFSTAEVGNSNAGHEYGVELSAEEKWDLVEYLKTL